MAKQSKLDVSKWQAARPRWVYTAALWFYYRMIEVAFLDARTKEGGNPTDEALLARDWIARSQAPAAGAPHEFCELPGVLPDVGLGPGARACGLAGCN